MKHIIRTSLLVGSLSFLGCGGSGDSKGPDVQEAPTAQSGAAGQPNVVAAQSGVQPVVGNAVGTEPGEVVAVFLDSLRRGDENSANAVLTPLALEELKKTDFVIQPPGTPDGTYQIGRIGFPYEDKNVALVECKWNEPMPGKQAVELDIVCEVHKEQAGWRISAMCIKEAGSEDATVLNFEDGKSLQAMLEQATRPQTAQTLQTGLPPQMQVPQLPQPGQLPTQPQFTQQPQLPQLPTQNSPGPISIDNANPPQIALPPLPSGPIQR